MAHDSGAELPPLQQLLLSMPVTTVVKASVQARTPCTLEHGLGMNLHNIPRDELFFGNVHFQDPDKTITVSAASANGDRFTPLRLEIYSPKIDHEGAQKPLASLLV